MIYCLAYYLKGKHLIQKSTRLESNNMEEQHVCIRRRVNGSGQSQESK